MTRDPLRHVGMVTIAFLVGCSAATQTSAPAQPQRAPAVAPARIESSIRASVSTAQAERGRVAFRQSCGECHGPSDFRGRDFLFRWGRRTAWDFFRNVRQNMPESLPGSLPDEVYVDVVAYVLVLNGYSEDGDELVATEEGLDRLPMDGGQRGPAGAKERR